MASELPQSGRPFDELRRISRVLELIQIIAINPQRYLRRDFAERFCVSERMIQKDLDLIRHGLKLSLVHSQEGYHFERMPRLPAVQYSFSEALALLLAVLASSQSPGIFHAELGAAVGRLESLFPEELSVLLRQVGRPLSPTAPKKHRQDVLMLLSRALMENRKVFMAYETRSRGGEVNERTVRPYYLMPYVRSWQLIAHCERRDAVLMFKIDRIREATLLEERYRIPGDFNLDDYMGMAWGIMREDEREPEDVELRFESEAGHWVLEEQWHKSQQSEELKDGSIVFRLCVVATPEFINWILYYGRRVEVIKPAWLRARVAEEHRKAAELNAARLR
jgi:predicted DNA-binding transcriptional regulator YafY